MSTPTPLDGIANPQDRLRELVWLSDRLRPEQLQPVLLCALGDSYPPLRERAAQELARQDLGGPMGRALRALARQEPAELEGAPAPSLPVARAACLALRGAPDAETARALAELTEHEDADLRYQALVALFEIDPADEVLRPVVTARLEDPDDEVAAVAAQCAAARAFEGVLSQLAARRRALDGDLRLHFTLALVELMAHEPEVSEGLIEELFEELEAGLASEVTVAASAQGLVALARQRGQLARAERALKGLLGRWLLHPLLKVEAAAHLAQLGEPSGLDHLSQAFDSRRKDARGYAIDVAGRLGLGALYGRVVRVARDPGDYHNDTAIIALSNYGTEQARELLAQLREEHPDEECRELAARALRAPGSAPTTWFNV